MTLKDYRDLQEENTLKQSGVSKDVLPMQDILNTPLPVLSPGGLRNTAAEWNQEYYAGQQLDYTPEASEAGFGTDRRDKALGLGVLGDQEHDLEHYRAEAQSNASKVFNGVAKFFPVMGTTFADGVAGTIIGAFNVGKHLGGAIAGEEEVTAGSILNAFVDNPVSQKLLNIQDYFEKVFPNYYTDEERNDQGKWWTHINANMIGDQFIKNLGFTAGAVLSGMVSSGVSRGIRSGGTAASNIIKAGAAASSGDDAAVQGLRRLALNRTNNAAMIKEGEAAARSFRKTGIFDQIAGGLGGAVGEGRIEALHAAREFYDGAVSDLNTQYATLVDSVDNELFEQHPEWFVVDDNDNPELVSPVGQAERQRRLSEIEQEYNTKMDYLDSQASKVANTVFALNIPLLTFDNIFEFGKLFGGGFNTMRKQLRRATRAADGYRGLGSVAGAAASGIANVAVEGFEEINQKVMSEGAKDIGNKNLAAFYNDGNDAYAVKTLGQWLQSMVQSGVDVYADPSSWEEFAIGALTGAIPMYNGTGKITSADSWGGGFMTVKDRLRDMKDNADIAKTLNDYVTTDKFQDIVHTYTRHAKYANIMEDAAKAGNKFVFHTAQSKDLINLVAAFHKAGRSADLSEFIQRFSTLSDDDIADVREALSKEDNSGITQDSTDDDVRAFVSKRVQDMKDTVDAYTRAYDSIASRAPIDTPEDVLTEYAFTAAQLNNFDKRFFDIWEGTQEQPGVRDRLKAFFTVEAANAVDSNGHALSAEEQAKRVADRMGGVEEFLRGTNIIDIRRGSAADALSSEALMRHLTAVKRHLENKGVWKETKETTTPTKELLDDVKDMISLVAARKNYYRALADPQHNILTGFTKAAKTKEQTRKEAIELADKDRAEALPDPQSVQELKAMVNDPSLSPDARERKQKDLFAKSTPVTKLYKKLRQTTDRLREVARNKYKGEVGMDVRAMLEFVFDQESVADLPSLYDYDFPVLLPLEDFVELLFKYNPTMAPAVTGQDANTILDTEEKRNAMQKRYNTARRAYYDIINATKAGNKVEGVQDEYGQPVAGADENAPTVKPSPTPSPNAENLIREQDKEEKKAAPTKEKVPEKEPAKEKEKEEAPAEKPTPAQETPKEAPKEQASSWSGAGQPQLNPEEGEIETAASAEDKNYRRAEEEAQREKRKASVQAGDNLMRDTRDMVLFEESAIPELAVESQAQSREEDTSNEARKKGITRLRSFAEVAKEKLKKQQETKKKVEGAGNYDGIYSKIEFPFVNEGHLTKGSDITFSIYPESFYSNGATATDGSPIKTVFMTYGDHVVGVLRDEFGTYDRREIYGHNELYKAINKEYKTWKETHDPEREIFTFGSTEKGKNTKVSKVWRVRRGRIQFSQDSMFLSGIPGYNNTAPIVFYSRNKGFIPIKGISEASLSKIPNLKYFTPAKAGGVYYLVRNSDGSYIPVRLTFAHFNTEEAAGQQGSPVYDKVYTAFKNMFEDKALWDTSTDDFKKASDEAVLAIKQDIGNYIYTGNLGFSFGTSDGVQTFRVYTRVLDEKGLPVKKANGNDKLEPLFDVKLNNEDGTPKPAHDLAVTALLAIQDKVNPQIQLDMSDRASAARTLQSYIDAGYVTANVESFQVRGSSFYINPYDPVTKTFVPVFKETKPTTVTESSSSADYAKKKKEAEQAKFQQQRDEDSYEIRQILERKRSRLETKKDADFMDPSVVSPEVRDSFMSAVATLRDKVLDGGSSIQQLNAAQEVMNMAYEIGAIPESAFALVKTAYSDLRKDGIVVEDLYATDYDSRNDVSYVPVTVHYPRTVSIVSKVVKPLIRDKNGKVVQPGVVEVSIGDGTRQMLRRRTDIKFESANHTYTRISDGIQLEGVTTLMANQGRGVDYSQVANGDPVKRREILAKAAAKGTAIHEAIQDYDNGIDRGEDGSFTGNKTRTVYAVDQETGQEYGPVTVNVASAVNAYRKIGLPVIASEYLVSDGNYFASMIDKVMRVDDKTVDLADLKTTSVLHEDALKTQLSIYAFLFELQNPGVKVRNLYGVHIQKNGSTTLVPVDRLSNDETRGILTAEKKRIQNEASTGETVELKEEKQDEFPLPSDTELSTPSEYSAEDMEFFEEWGMPEDDDYMSTEQAGKYTSKADWVKEQTWLDRALPHISEQDRLQLKEGLLNMADASGYAYGRVHQGILTLSSDAVEGTVYHEAFHWVFRYLLSDEERSNVYKEARRIWGTTSAKVLDEHLADAFREWKLGGTALPIGQYLKNAFTDRSLFRGIAEFFRRLLLFVTHYNRIMPYTLGIYNSLDQGEYADRNEDFADVGKHTIVSDSIQEAVKKVNAYKNPHIVQSVDYVVNKDGTGTIVFATPLGQLISRYDYTFPKDKIEEAVAAIKDLYAHGLGLDLTNGEESIYYSEEEGFVFSTILPNPIESQGETLAAFYKAIGKTGMNFEYLSDEVKKELAEKEWTEESYNDLSQAEKDHLIRCIGV